MIEIDDRIHLLLSDLIFTNHCFQHDALLRAGFLHMIAQLKVCR